MIFDLLTQNDNYFNIKTFLKLKQALNEYVDKAIAILRVPLKICDIPHLSYKLFSDWHYSRFLMLLPLYLPV